MSRSLLCTVVFVVGCSGDGDPDPRDDFDSGADPAADASPGSADGAPFVPDAAAGTPDAVPVDCTVMADLGDLGVIGGYAVKPVSDIYFQGSVTPDVAPDELVLELIPGFGVFNAGLATGNYAIQGAELNYATCGLCVRILTDVESDTPGVGHDWYMATGGTVRVKSLEGTLRIDLADVEFEHVSINLATFESTPVGDGCTTRIVAAEVDQVF